MCSHCVQQKTRQTWLPFEFVVFLCDTCNLTCILVDLHFQMSSRKCLWKMMTCVVQDSGTMVDVSQVMIDHTIVCKIHGSRLTTIVRNELNYSCSCTKVLVFLSMKLGNPISFPIESPFLSTKGIFVFLFFVFPMKEILVKNSLYSCCKPKPKSRPD